MHFHVPSSAFVSSLLSLTRCILAFCAFLWHLGSCSYQCLLLAQAEFRELLMFLSLARSGREMTVTKIWIMC